METAWARENVAALGDGEELRVPIRLGVTVAEGILGSEHKIVADVRGEDRGDIDFRLDDEQVGDADWALIKPGLYSILLRGRSYEARVIQTGNSPGARNFAVRVGASHYAVEVRDPRSRRRGSAADVSSGPQEVTAPMPGKIVKLLVQESEEVASGQGLLVMEAMKMQNEMRAPRAGRVERIFISEGAGVEMGVPLLRLV